ncbi:MAG: NADH-quinone oxidoreductase subunit M [Deltaproteobacteria bacterium]|nr:NADH-quinone oxidoreductase subunit M [Deltaproteobacteria bacterium]
MHFPILSLLIAIPLLGAIALFFFPNEEKEAIRLTALGFTLVNFIVSLLLLLYFDTSTYKMQFVERYQWIPWAGVQYLLGMDGISLVLMLLTTFTAVLAVLCSWTAVEERVKEYMIHLLILEVGMVGVFISLDMILFFLFWEVGLIPMFFLIGIWGGKRKLYANIKFFLYTLFGSVFMLAGIIALYLAHGRATGVYTFDLLKLYEVTYTYNVQWWVFIAFFLGFAIKVPVFPFHTWLPDAHVEAPTAGSVILAAVLLKMGIYGFLRFNLPLTLQASYALAPLVVLLAVIGIVYGAFLAMAQTDIKKMVAYSSVSHLGVVMAGIFAMNQHGIDGGVLQMINHGVSTGGLFLVIGMIYERRHTREMGDFGGLSKVMPAFAAFTIIIALSSIAIPGTNGFVGELFVLIGLFKYGVLPGAVAIIGIVAGPVYMLGMCRKVIFGKVDNKENAGLKDLSAREVITLAPIIVLILWIGIFPGHFFDLTRASTAHLAEMIKTNEAAMEAAGRTGRVSFVIPIKPRVYVGPGAFKELEKGAAPATR